MGKCEDNYFNSSFRSESGLILFVHTNAFYNVKKMLYMTIKLFHLNQQIGGAYLWYTA